MHEDPQVPNYGKPGKGPLLQEGMVLAIEPMTTAGRPAVRVASDGWAIFSQDDSLAAHFEFTVAITAGGPRVLTPWHLRREGCSPAPASASRSEGRLGRRAGWRHRRSAARAQSRESLSDASATIAVLPVRSDSCAGVSSTR